MNERRLREDLRRIPLPGEDEARERAWALIAAAYREQDRSPMRLGRVRARARALALTAAAVLAGLVLALSPAGADVRDWLGSVIDSGERTDELALTRLPAAGKLLVNAGSGLWTVDRDGSRRLLGDYEQGSWSPHGMYVAAAKGRRLTALDPRGDVRWSITRGPISDPVWSPDPGYRVAYRSGSELRVIWGDGTNDQGFGAVADVAPAWRPGEDRANVLAYVDDDRHIRLLDLDVNRSTVLTDPVPRLSAISWARSGDELLASSPDVFRIFAADGTERWTYVLPPGEQAVAAALAPSGNEVTAVLRSTRGEPRGSVVELSRFGRPLVRRVFTGSGSLDGLSVSPDGSRLLVGWPDADQWLFFPAETGHRIVTVGNVSGQFDARAGQDEFPSAEGWCCRKG